LQEEEVHTFQKPVFTQPLQNIEKEENHNARFTARLIPVGDPTLKVVWYQNGKLLSKGTRINTVHDFGCVSLDITGLRSSDEGVYECKATNSLGEAVTTASCKVFAKGSLLLDSQHPEGMRKITELERTKVTRRQVSDDQQAFEKPAFVTPLSGTDMVAEGQQAHMECRVVPLGDSSMKFQWFKNGEALQMGSRFHVTQDFGFVTLDIASCVAEDSGMYMVKAVNLTGEASSSFALHVGGKSGVMGEALHPDSYKKIQALEAEKSARRQVSPKTFTP
jgi:titin